MKIHLFFSMVHNHNIIKILFYMQYIGKSGFTGYIHSTTSEIVSVLLNQMINLFNYKIPERWMFLHKMGCLIGQPLQSAPMYIGSL